MTEAAELERRLAAIWREQWGRLLALLVAQYRRIDLAEDALGDAFEAAARTWPADGVPGNPPAWLLTTARRRALDRLRAEAMAARKLPLLAVERDVQERADRTMADAGEVIVDERLRLVLLCAHPTLPAGQAAALTLRLVLGISTPDIARLFLVSTATMAARYAELEELTGSSVMRLNRAVAVAEVEGPEAGLAMLAGLRLPGHRVASVRAELLRRSGRPQEARAAYELALQECDNEPERAHLRERLTALDSQN